MGKIVLLDDLTINKIAAGEVVERPASVVKEMVENSIDAGAKNITIEIKNGGISLIKITDDGCGLAEDDMEISFERHATSKIRKSEDLETVTTMGFRGVALASIASIANVEMITKRAEDETGHRLSIEGGRILSKSEIGAPNGTQITVKNLFFNTPVRYKFLKKDFTEAGYIEDVVTRLALINKNVSIKFINSGKTVIQTNGNGDTKSLIYSIYGKDVANGIITVDYVYEGIKVIGVVGKKEIARSNRSNQIFFVNNRYVRDKNLTAAVTGAYKDVLPTGKYGFVILNIEMDSKMVDVNVHPAKLEVRFEEENKVFKAVYNAIKSGLAKADAEDSVRRNVVFENTSNLESDKENNEESTEEVLEKENKKEEFKPRSGVFSGFFKKILGNQDNESEDLENNNLREIYEDRKNAKERLFDDFNRIKNEESIKNNQDKEVASEIESEDKPAITLFGIDKKEDILNKKEFSFSSLGTTSGEEELSYTPFNASKIGNLEENSKNSFSSIELNKAENVLNTKENFLSGELNKTENILNSIESFTPSQINKIENKEAIDFKLNEAKDISVDNETSSSFQKITLNNIEENLSKKDSIIENPEVSNEETTKENSIKEIKLGNTIISSDTKELNFNINLENKEDASEVVEKSKLEEQNLNQETLKIENTKLIEKDNSSKTEIIDSLKKIVDTAQDETIIVNNEEDVKLDENKTQQNVDSVTERILKMKMDSDIDDTQMIDTAKVREALTASKEEIPMTDEFANMYKQVFGTEVAEIRKTKEEENAKLNISTDLKLVETIENNSIFEEETNYIPEVKYKYIGIIFDTNIIIEIQDEMYMIDESAANERLIYEKIKENFYNDETDSQMLLLADIITLSNKEMSIARNNKDLFMKAGFDFEEFGENTLKLIAVPSMCEEMNTKKLFIEILNEMDTVAVTEDEEKENKFIATIAYKIVSNSNISFDETQVEILLNKLLKLSNPFIYPYGRQVAIKITKSDMEKRFSRR